MSSFISSFINRMASTNSPADGALDAALQSLADISPGQTPSIWPLAWGWWVLILLIVFAIVGIYWIVARYISKNKFKRSALKAVLNVSSSEPQALSTLHAVLRSSIIHYFPSESINSLQGQAWHELLQLKAKPHKKVDQQCLTQLTQLEASLYAKLPSINVDDAKQAVYLWIKHCLPPSTAELIKPETVETDNQGVQHV
jgi:hypothetical protein